MSKPSTSLRDERDQNAEDRILNTSIAVGQASHVIASSLTSARQERAANSTDTATASLAATNSQQREQFSNAFQQCLNGFKELAERLGVSIESFMESTANVLDLPKLKRQFEQLSTLGKALVVLGLLGLLALLHWLSWEGISYLWSKLMDFINSETGQEILRNTATVLTWINNSGVVEQFSQLLSAGVDAQATEGADNMETNVTEPLNDSLQILHTQTPFMAIITVLTAWFAYLSSNVRN